MKKLKEITMKMLFACLSLVLSCSAFAESPISVEPLLLNALFEQSGTLKVQGEWSGKLSELLAESMAFSGDLNETSLIHTCEYQNKGWTCRLSINSKYTDDQTTGESAVIITYDSVYDSKSDSFKVKKVRADFAG
jgi:hypothetical protein